MVRPLLLEVSHAGRPFEARRLTGDPPVRMEREDPPVVDDARFQPVPDQSRLTRRQRPRYVEIVPFEPIPEYRHRDPLLCPRGYRRRPRQLGQPLPELDVGARGAHLKPGCRPHAARRQDRCPRRERRPRGRPRRRGGSDRRRRRGRYRRSGRGRRSRRASPGGGVTVLVAVAVSVGLPASSPQPSRAAVASTSNTRMYRVMASVTKTLPALVRFQHPAPSSIPARRVRPKRRRGESRAPRPRAR